MKKVPTTSKNNRYLDTPKVTIERGKLLKKKFFLYNTYVDFYHRIFDALSPANKKGKVVELGSGGGFIKEIIPNVITSDVLKLPSVDRQFSALKMPFKKQTINAFVMIDVFHHINDIEKFLNEANRCLKKGGQIIMIEPASTTFGKFVWKNFHHEPYDQNAAWSFKTTGPLSGANGALPWIVFERDKNIFKKKYPTMKIEELGSHTPLKYLFSGGFTVKQLLPDFCYPFIKFLEKLITPLNTQVGLFYTIVIFKTK